MTKPPRLNSPTKVVGDPLYPLECQFALEPSVIRLIDLATELGWEKQHVLCALMNLVASRVDEHVIN